MVLNLHEKRKPRANSSIVNLNQKEYSLRNARIPHTLIQKALTRSNNRPLGPQSLQGHCPLARITTTHPVHKHIDPMSLTQQIERRLRHTNMRLYADNGNLILLIGVRLQGESQVRHKH